MAIPFVSIIVTTFLAIFQKPSNQPFLYFIGALIAVCLVYVFYWITLYVLNKRKTFYVMEVKLPAIDEEFTPQYIEKMKSTFASLQGYVLSNTTKLSIEVYKVHASIVFQIGSNNRSVLDKTATTLKQIQDIRITSIEDTLATIKPLYCKTVSNVKDFYQITQDENFFDNLLNLFNSLPEDVDVGIQFILRGVNKNEEMQRRRSLENRAVKGKRRQTDRETYLFYMYQKKQEGNLFKLKINVVANDSNYLTSLVSHIKTLNFEENIFFSRGESKQNILTRFISPDTYFSNVHFRRKYEGSYVTNKELAYVFHPTSIQLGGLTTKKTTDIEAHPEVLTQRNDNILIGTTQTQRGTTEQLYYPLENFYKHIYAVGKTGTGKSSLLVAMLNALIHKKGNTIFVFDPHGDMLHDVLVTNMQTIEKSKNIVYLNVLKTERTYTINPLFAFDKTTIQKAVIRDKLLDIIKNETEEVAGGTTTGNATYNRMRQLIDIALEFPDAYFMFLTKEKGIDKKRAEQLVQERQITLNDLPYLLEKNYDYASLLEKVFAQSKSDVGRYVQKLMMEHMKQQAVNEAVQVRMSQLLHPATKLIYEGNLLNIEEIMTSGKTFLFPIPASIFGTHGARGLLQILFSLLWVHKQEVEKDKRQNTYVFIDEFQNAQIEDIPEILSEARKYKLYLIASNQYLEQLKERIKHAFFGTIGTLIAFTVGAGENGAATLAKNFDGSITEKDLTLLPSHQAYIKTKIPDTNESRTFSFTTIPVDTTEEHNKTVQQMNNDSLKGYGELKVELKEKLARKQSAPSQYFLEGI